jgi:hypothetical protein
VLYVSVSYESSYLIGPGGTVQDLL